MLWSRSIARSVESSFLSISITCMIMAVLAIEMMKCTMLNLTLTPSATALTTAPHMR